MYPAMAKPKLLPRRGARGSLIWSSGIRASFDSLRQRATPRGNWSSGRARTHWNPRCRSAGDKTCLAHVRKNDQLSVARCGRSENLTLSDSCMPASRKGAPRPRALSPLCKLAPLVLHGLAARTHSHVERNPTPAPSQLRVSFEQKIKAPQTRYEPGCQSILTEQLRGDGRSPRGKS
jgi:hypothetical protein